jgi:hypothetical protein
LTINAKARTDPLNQWLVDGFHKYVEAAIEEDTPASMLGIEPDAVRESYLKVWLHLVTPAGNS